jgi:hypothetical protein
MNSNDSFEAEKVFSTELQNGINPLERNSKMHLMSIMDHHQMLDFQMPSFIRGDEDEDAADLF